MPADLKPVLEQAIVSTAAWPPSMAFGGHQEGVGEQVERASVPQPKGLRRGGGGALHGDAANGASCPPSTPSCFTMRTR